MKRIAFIKQNFNTILLYGLTIFSVLMGGAVVYCLIELYRVFAVLHAH